MFYFSIGLTIVANVLYHISQKSISKTVNPILSLAVSYLIAILLTAIMLPFFPIKTSLNVALREINWATFAVGIAIVGVEIGFLLAYRAGWNISLASITTSSAISLSLIPIGALVFKENLSLTNLVGVIFCIIGLILVIKR